MPRDLLLVVGLVGLLGGASSCSFQVPRNVVSDALAKDFAPARTLPTVREPVVDEPEVPPPEPPEEYRSIFVPIPILATDPNSGFTGGLMPVTVIQEYERITGIAAPWLVWNEVRGLEGKLRLFRYLDRDSQLKVFGGSSTGGAHQYEAEYLNRRLPPGNLFLEASGLYEEVLRERYFGPGNTSDEDDETTYVRRSTGASIRVGAFFPFDVQVSTTQRFRTTSIGRGRIDDLPDTRDLFPAEPALDGRTQEVSNRVDLLVDSRDSPTVPTEGVLLDVYWEIADERLASDVDYQKFGFDARAFLPFRDAEWVLAGRMAGQIVDGEDLPFFVLSSLGGRESIRGFPEGRFVDANRVHGSFEVRWTFLSFHVMDVFNQLQAATFVDAGRVYAPGEELGLTDLHAAVGGAIRLIVPNSNLVGSIDMGFGSEGSATFVALGYPF